MSLSFTGRSRSEGLAQSVGGSRGLRFRGGGRRTVVVGGGVGLGGVGLGGVGLGGGGGVGGGPDAVAEDRRTGVPGGARGRRRRFRLLGGAGPGQPQRRRFRRFRRFRLFRRLGRRRTRLDLVARRPTVGQVSHLSSCLKK